MPAHPESRWHGRSRLGLLPVVFLILASVRPASAQITCPGSDATVLDCNSNGTDDFCDLQLGTSQDCNTNGIPDECDVGEPTLAWRWVSVSGPSPRSDHAMAYDSARGVTVLFGGYNDTGPLGDTWEWDGNGWELRSSSSGPSPRSDHAMAYDSARGVTVLFGGSASSSSNETWEWDGAFWTQPAATGPSPRTRHAMAYDRARGVTVLFGGCATGYCWDSETWEWDGSAWDLRPIGAPSPRVDHTMVYDSLRRVTVLFGGWNGAGLRETWERDGDAWKMRNTGGPARYGGNAMAFDSARRLTVLHSGNDRKTWEWDGSSWTTRSSQGPDIRYDHAMAFDSARGVVVLFGGRFIPDYVYGDTWILRPASRDCNANGIPDECSSVETDCNANGIPDACEAVAPCPQIMAATSWRTHGGGVGRDEIVINTSGHVDLGNVTSEPRAGGIVELRMTFDAAPGGPGPSPVSIEQRTCGDGGTYGPYTGASTSSTSIEGSELVLTFAPALENARTYRITISSGVTWAPNQSIEVRGLIGDIDSNGRVNAVDRSLVVRAWTSPGGYSATTDVDLSGATDAVDRGLVINAWTAPSNCAP